MNNKGLRLKDLKPTVKKKRKRVGRGSGSGRGNQSGRGTKGQRSRSGRGGIWGLEGGQTPLWKRIPKRGFKNPNRKSYLWVNIDILSEKYEEGSEVTPQSLHEKGILKKKGEVKILGRGELKKKLIVRAHRFSKSAKGKIEAAGGKAILIER